MTASPSIITPGIASPDGTSFRDRHGQGGPAGTTPALTRELVRQGIVAGKLDPFRASPASTARSPLRPWPLPSRSCPRSVKAVGLPDHGGDARPVQRGFCRADRPRHGAVRAVLAGEPGAPGERAEPARCSSRHSPLLTGSVCSASTTSTQPAQPRAPAASIQPDVAHVGGITERCRRWRARRHLLRDLLPARVQRPRHAPRRRPRRYHHPQPPHARVPQPAPGVLEVIVGGYRYDPQFFDVPGPAWASTSREAIAHRIDPALGWRPGNQDG